jgi:hypothetical protein
MGDLNNDTHFLLSETKKLLSIINGLEKRFQRKFSLDGHLFGSIGETFAEKYYGLKLYNNLSTKGYDAVTKDGNRVQIKITQIDSVDIQKAKLEPDDNDYPDWMIVLFLNKKDAKLYEVYNGPGYYAFRNAKPINAGYYNRSILSLHNADKEIPEVERIKTVKGILLEKWQPGMKN